VSARAIQKNGRAVAHLAGKGGKLPPAPLDLLITEGHDVRRSTKRRPFPSNEARSLAARIELRPQPQGQVQLARDTFRGVQAVLDLHTQGIQRPAPECRKPILYHVRKPRKM